MKVTNETKVGAMAAISIAILILGYNFLRGEKLLSKEKVYYAVYDKVDGMKNSSFVQLNGLTIGRVKELYLENNRQIIVSMVISGNLDIPKNTIARIMNSGFLGDKVIRLELSDEQKFMKSGDTLVAARGVNLSEGVMKELAPVKEMAETVLTSVDSVLTLMKLTFNEKTRANIESSVKNLNQSSEQLNTLLKEQSVRLDKIFNNVESITNNLNKNNKEITTVLSNAAAITDSIRRSHLIQTISDAQVVVNEFSTVLEKINKGQGTLGMLVNNAQLYTHLDSTSANLNKLVIDMKLNPSRYVHFSVFGKKDKIAK